MPENESKGIVFNLGLSRLMRYSYGGFLLIVISSLLATNETGKVITAISPPVTLIAALVIGAALYFLHRNIVIPIHHLGLCLLFFLWDFICGKLGKPEETNSPTRYLRKKVTIGVHFGKGIIAYTRIRRSDFFKKDKEKLDVDHAENGLLVMTGTGMLIASIISFMKFPNDSDLYSSLLLFIKSNDSIYFYLFILFYVASYIPAWIQHSLECARMKKQPDRLRDILFDAGIIKDHPDD